MVTTFKIVEDNIEQFFFFTIFQNALDGAREILECPKLNRYIENFNPFKNIWLAMFYFGLHYVKSVRICSNSGPYFPAFSTPYLSEFSPNAGKYGPE